MDKDMLLREKGIRIVHTGGNVMKEDRLLRKSLAVGIILLFVGTCLITATAHDIERPLPISGGKWLYVGGSGPGNYTRIQDAINNSSPEDTVYVYHGIYHETLSIDVTALQLIGEGRDVTVLDANADTAVTIMQDSVVIKGFMILAQNNSRLTDGIYIAEYLKNIKICDNNLSKTDHGVIIDAYNNYHLLENNMFYLNFLGIVAGVFYSDGHTVIRNNTFVDGFLGLDLHGIDNEISNNTFLRCRQEGISQYGGLSTIRNNVFIGNTIGLLTRYGGNTISGNLFENNTIGLKGETIYDDIIIQNNFIHNQRHAVFSLRNRSQGMSWNGNYWGGSVYPLGIKVIFGRMRTPIQKIIQFPPDVSFYWIPWVNFDWHPATKPYNIPRFI
jgi:nitrous oxidase accessory protein NosD